VKLDSANYKGVTNSKMQAASEEEKEMLEITADESGNSTTFRLRGALAGPSVADLERSWRVAQRGDERSFRLDLRKVEKIDDVGKKLLCQMFSRGVEIVVGLRPRREPPNQ
jgi:ABC-type transporter Mla MlaB component